MTGANETDHGGEAVVAGVGARSPLGIHALVWVSKWDTASAEIAAWRSAEAGYDLVEMPMLDPGGVDATRLRSVLERAAIDVRTSLGLPFDADISSENPEVVARGEQLLGRALEASSDLGAAFLTGVLYSALGKYAHPPTTTGWDNAARALGRLADRAGVLGVTLGLEVVNRYESNLINTAESALRMIGDIGRANVAVHLDTYHMNIEEADLSRAVRVCGGRLGYVHAGESHRGYLGAGQADFASVARSLVEVGYDGPITFEAFSTPTTPTSLVGTLAVWRQLWDDPMDLALSARGYMEAVLAAARHAHDPVPK
ncbi:MAG: sugar phosphate isomerase/epimerase family protein [Acidimicrobiales bacterium]